VNPEAVHLVAPATPPNGCRRSVDASLTPLTVRSVKRHIALAALALVVLPAACSGDDSGTDPTVESVSPDDTHDKTLTDFTSTITIKPTGFEPQKASAVLGDTLTFVNETSEEQTITFTNGSLDIDGNVTTVGPIPPGASISVPDRLAITLSLVYESTGLPGKQGQLQIDSGVKEI
jgi:plastocyanin